MSPRDRVYVLALAKQGELERHDKGPNEGKRLNNTL